MWCEELQTYLKGELGRVRTSHSDLQGHGDSDNSPSLVDPADGLE